MLRYFRGEWHRPGGSQARIWGDTRCWSMVPLSGVGEGGQGRGGDPRALRSVMHQNYVTVKGSPWRLTAASQPLAVTSQPLAVTSQPLAVTSQPLAVTSQPLAVTSQPLAVTSQPLAVTSQPLAVTSQPLAVRPHLCRGNPAIPAVDDPPTAGGLLRSSTTSSAKCSGKSSASVHGSGPPPCTDHSPSGRPLVETDSNSTPTGGP